MNDSETNKLKAAEAGMGGEPVSNGITYPKTTNMSGGVQQPDDLHDLFTTSEEEDPLKELRNDPNYSALIRDLEYIAKQARMLFEPAQEAPSDEVWQKIQSQLPNKPNDA